MAAVLQGVKSTGTTVTFKPDAEIFKTTLEFDFDRVASRMDELAYLNAGVSLKLIDRRCVPCRSPPSNPDSRTGVLNGVLVRVVVAAEGRRRR